MSQQVSHSEPSAHEHSLPVSTYLFQRSKVRLIGLLALPMTWLVGVISFPSFSSSSQLFGSLTPLHHE